MTMTYWLLNWWLYILFTTNPAAYDAAIAGSATCWIQSASPVSIITPSFPSSGQRPMGCPYLPKEQEHRLAFVGAK